MLATINPEMAVSAISSSRIKGESPSLSRVPEYRNQSKGTGHLFFALGRKQVDSTDSGTLVTLNRRYFIGLSAAKKRCIERFELLHKPLLVSGFPAMAETHLDTLSGRR